MKKSTLNAIMTGVIIFLVIAIIVLAIKISLRPKVETSSELPSETEIESVEPSEEPSQETTPQQEAVNRVRIVNDNINVRSGPGTEYERLGAAYGGYDFELLDQSTEGWTKIMYDGKEAYVCNDYIEVVPMILDENGKYVDYVSFE